MRANNFPIPVHREIIIDVTLGGACAQPAGESSASDNHKYSISEPSFASVQSLERTRRGFQLSVVIFPESTTTVVPCLKQHTVVVRETSFGSVNNNRTERNETERDACHSISDSIRMSQKGKSNTAFVGKVGTIARCRCRRRHRHHHHHHRCRRLSGVRCGSLNKSRGNKTKALLRCYSKHIMTGFTLTGEEYC